MSPVALGYGENFPLILYHTAECLCHLGLAASVFITVAITIERYQVLGSALVHYGVCSVGLFTTVP
jgi:hypothetical protein